MKKIILLFAGLAFFTFRIQAQVTDYDGNVYDTVTIGTQTWLKQNLKVTHYSNGDTIANVTNNSQWSNLGNGAYCNYDNNLINGNTYGRLYNWFAVNDNRNIAPIGWHVATDAEFKTLEMFLGMSQLSADTTGLRGTNQGSEIKEAGYSHWSSSNTGANNSSNFTALPGSYRTADFGSPNGEFGSSFGYEAYFWTSTASGILDAYDRVLSSSQSGIYRYGTDKKEANAVRCVKGIASGINDIKQEGLQIYPNPSNGKFIIETEGMKNGEVEIYSLIGEKIYSGKLKQQTSNEIDVSNSPKGIYFVKFYNAGKTSTKKIIVQ